MKNKIIYAFMNAYSQGKSGGDVCFIEIFKRLKPKNITVVTSSLGRRLCREEGLQANFVITTRERSFKNTYLTYLQRIVSGLINCLKIRKVDLIYATSDALPDIFPAMVLKLRFPKTIFVTKMFHLIPKNRFYSYFFQQISLILIRFFADVVIVDSNILSKQLISFGILRSKLHTIYPGITIRKQNKSEKRYDGVFMSRLHKSKGIYDVLCIWKNIIKTLPQAKLAVIGQGPKKILTKLKKQIIKQNLDKNIELLGFLPDKKAFSIINSSKVFLFPSHEEGFGMIIGEVLSCDVPVVAYDLPVYNETFKPYIQTVSSFNKQKFAEMILSILNNTSHKNLKDPTDYLKNLSWDSCSNYEYKLMHKMAY